MRYVSAEAVEVRRRTEYRVESQENFSAFAF